MLSLLNSYHTLVDDGCPTTSVYKLYIIYTLYTEVVIVRIKCNMSMHADDHVI